MQNHETQLLQFNDLSSFTGWLYFIICLSQIGDSHLMKIGITQQPPLIRLKQIWLDNKQRLPNTSIQFGLLVGHKSGSQKDVKSWLKNTETFFHWKYSEFNVRRLFLGQSNLPIGREWYNIPPNELNEISFFLKHFGYASELGVLKDHYQLGNQTLMPTKVLQFNSSPYFK